MDSMKRILVAVSLVVVVAAFVPAVKAAGIGEANWPVQVTFQAPIQVGSLVLASGTYEFQLVDSSVARNVILIYSVTQKRWVGMAMGINVERQNVSSMTGFTFEDTVKGAPKALEYWFYPGWNRGIKFIYSRNQATDSFAAANLIASK